MVATDGLIGTFASLDEASLRQNRCFLYHVVGGAALARAGRRDGRDQRGARGRGARRRAPSCAAAPRSWRSTRRGAVTWREGEGEHTAAAGHVLANVAPPVLARLLGEAPPPRPRARSSRSTCCSTGCPRCGRASTRRSRSPGPSGCTRTPPSSRPPTRGAARRAARAPAGRAVLPHAHRPVDRRRRPRHTLTLFGLHAPARLFAGDEAARPRHPGRALPRRPRRAPRRADPRLHRPRRRRRAVHRGADAARPRARAAPCPAATSSTATCAGPGPRAHGDRWGVATAPRARARLRRGRPARRRGQRRRRPQRRDGRARLQRWTKSTRTISAWRPPAAGPVDGLSAGGRAGRLRTRRR